MDGLPLAMQEKYRAFPEQLRNADEKFQKKTSAEPCARAVALINTAHEDKNGNFTQRIKRLANALERAASEAEAITSRELRTQFFEEAKKVRDVLLRLELDRRAAYQEWALGIVNGFMVNWNNYKVGTDKKINDLLEEYPIYDIDESLLVPEVSRVFGRVMTCVIGELSAKDGSNAEYEMAATSKKRLEEF